MKQLQLSLMMAMLWAANPVHSKIINKDAANCGKEYYYSYQICSGEKFPFKGEELFLDGVYFGEFKDLNGCDSLVTLELSFMPNALTELIRPFCLSDTLLLAGQKITQPGTYELEYTASWGCDSIVILHLTPLASSEVQVSETLCQGDSFYFNNQWLSNAGSYRTTYTQSNGCDSTVELNLTINNLEPDIVIEGNALVAQTIADHYQWYTCPTLTMIPGENKRELTSPQSGEYALRIESKGCIDTSTCVMYTATSLNTPSEPIEVTAYPNPTRSSLTVSLNSIHSGEIQVFNQVGKQVHVQKFQNQSKIKLDTIHWLNGLYFLTVFNGNDSTTLRIQVQH